MRASSVFSSALFASVSVLVARADVFPNFPAGDVLKSGEGCHIAWGPDTNTSQVGAWKEMTIELMTGDNFNMVHLTTVATKQDGTVDGSFDWTCPEVVPNSAIYFYQFRSPHTPDFQWTTRFTIASATGEVTDPENDTQPGGGAIPWGTGALKDPSTAVAAPVFGSTSGTGSSTAGTGASVSQTTSFATTPTGPSSTPKLSTTTTPSSSQKTSSSSTNSSATPSNSNAAVSKSGMVDLHAMQAMVVLAASAMGFAILL